MMSVTFLGELKRQGWERTQVDDDTFKWIKFDSDGNPIHVEGDKKYYEIKSHYDAKYFW